MTVEGDERRVVWFRDVTRSLKGRINAGFDIDHPWVSKVEKLLG